jgi:ribonuclease E
VESTQPAEAQANLSFGQEQPPRAERERAPAVPARREEASDHREAPFAEPAPQPVATFQATPEPVVERTPLPHAPQVIASFAPPPATFQVVSEHERVAEEASRPVRRRARDAAPPPAEPLQLVETAAEKAARLAPVIEEEAPRRTKPRRRRVVEVPDEPLQLVETQPGEGVPPQA